MIDELIDDVSLNRAKPNIATDREKAMMFLVKWDPQEALYIAQEGGNAVVPGVTSSVFTEAQETMRRLRATPPVLADESFDSKTIGHNRTESPQHMPWRPIIYSAISLIFGLYFFCVNEGYISRLGTNRFWLDGTPKRTRISTVENQPLILSIQGYTINGDITFERLAQTFRADADKLAELNGMVKSDHVPAGVLRIGEGKKNIMYVRNDDKSLPPGSFSLSHDHPQTQAMSALNPNGGIDLDRNKMRMTVRQDAAMGGAQLQFDQLTIQRIKRDGFEGLGFQIESILPAPNLPLLLGLSK